MRANVMMVMVVVVNRSKTEMTVGIGVVSNMQILLHQGIGKTWKMVGRYHSRTP